VQTGHTREGAEVQTVSVAAHTGEEVSNFDITEVFTHELEHFTQRASGVCGVVKQRGGRHHAISVHTEVTDVDGHRTGELGCRSVDSEGRRFATRQVDGGQVDR